MNREMPYLLSERSGMLTDLQKPPNVGVEAATAIAVSLVGPSECQNVLFAPLPFVFAWHR